MKRLNHKTLVQIGRELKRQTEHEMDIELAAVGKDWEKFYIKVVDDWDAKPQFESRVEKQGDISRLYVQPTDSPEGQIFIYVNNGTGKGGQVGVPYIIRPRPDNPSGKLAFRGGYSARTQPPGQYGVGSGTASGNLIFAGEVLHPGIDPRRFDKRYAEDNSKQFVSRMKQAIRRGVKKVR